jgi:DNA mismatch endonuclease (patch repair protein)
VLRPLGFTYQPKEIYGKPDFANRKNKIAIFLDGCFWHGCPTHYSEPKSNVKFWRAKIKKNIDRDRQVTSELKKEGFIVIRAWEHQGREI